MNPNLILPVGTQVVSRIEVKNSANEPLCVQGAVGVIIESPTDNSHTYHIRLTNNLEITLHRHEFSIRRHFQRDEVNDWRLALHQEFDTALRKTVLPERPDYQRANAFLIKARRSYL